MRFAIALAAVAACHPTPLPPAPLPPLASSSSTGSASPTSPTPTPDVRVTTEADVTEAWVRGIHVLVKRNPGAEAVATGIYIAGGATNWTKDTAGIEQLALAVAVSGGTKHLDKDAFSKRLSDLGSSIYAAAGRDFSEIAAWSLAPAWDDTFALAVAAFREPAMPASEVEIERRRQPTQLKHELDDPDSRLGLLVAAGMYKDHPYANRAEGTLDTVAALTPDQLADHLAKLRVAKRLLVVVVGDVDPHHVIDSIGRQLGDLPAGAYAPEPLPDLAVLSAGQVEITADKLPTNYIEAVVPGPRWTDPDYAVARVAMTWLAQREFEEVRTKRNLSYAPGAGFEGEAAVPIAYLYVTAVDPRTTMKVMLDETRRMREAKIADHDLLATKAMLLTRTFVSGEAPADQAAQLASAQLAGGDWHFVKKLPELVKAVTADQVQAWCAKHLAHFHAFMIGDGGKLDRAAIERF